MAKIRAWKYHGPKPQQKDGLQRWPTAFSYVDGPNELKKRGEVKKCKLR